MEDLKFGQVLVTLLGGLAIFVLGMNLMTQALNKLAGSKMKALLGAFTRNRFAAALSGATITAAVQSSSVTTVLLVGFSSVGLISVAQSVGVIFGANVGSTFTAQIIAFKIAGFGAPLLALGLVIHLYRKWERFSQFGLFTLGLGAIFFGMQEMSEATYPLRDYAPFMEMMQVFHAPWVGILAGLIFTAIVQSSAATIGLCIILATQNILSAENAIAIALGANIGTCITAAFAAIGRPVAAWRIVVIHVVFNVAGALIWYAFIPQLYHISHVIASSFVDDSSVGREIAIAHTVFNTVNLLLFIGFTGPVAKLAYLVVPDKRAEDGDRAKPIYLDAIFLHTPSMAIDRARLETGRLASFALRLSEEAPVAAISGSEQDLAELSKRDDELDDLQTAILSYLAKIDAATLSQEELDSINEVIALANAWENIGDALDNHVLALGRDRLDTGLAVSDETKRSIIELHQALLEDMRLAMAITTSADPKVAEILREKNKAFNKLADEAEHALQARLLGRAAERMDLFRLESDLIGNLKRIHEYLRRISQLKPN